MHHYFTIGSSAPDEVKAKLFKDHKKKDGLWHPDTIAEVESDKAKMPLVGDDLRVARAAFVGLALQPPPTPEKVKHDWIPAFYVDGFDKKPIFPQDWGRFSKMWRRTTVPAE